MNAYFKMQLLSILMIAMLILYPSSNVFRMRPMEEENLTSNYNYKSDTTTGIANATETNLKFNVTDRQFGAIGNDQKDDREAIQMALNKAKEELINKRERTIEVYIPEGTYYISDILYIYSNTRLILDDNTYIIAGMKKNQFSNDVIKAKHLNSQNQKCETRFCSHEGYSQWKNIYIEGGIWNCNNADDSTKDMIGAFLFRHGEGLTLKNLTIENSSGHTINVSATKNVMIDGVTVKNARKSNKKGFLVESIHLDSAGIGEKQAYPVDGTPIKNIIIQNCIFDNVYTAIGNHSIYRKEDGCVLTNNIIIQNNIFNNIKYYAINAVAFENITIKGNIAKGKNIENNGKKAYAFLHTRNCTGSNVNFSVTPSANANVVLNFEYPIVEYNYKMSESEMKNRLYSNTVIQPSYILVEYNSNGGSENVIQKKVNISTGNNSKDGFVLPKNTFTRTGYKFKKWKVILDTENGEKKVGSYYPGQFISTKNLEWHHLKYKIYACWQKNKVV